MGCAGIGNLRAFLDGELAEVDRVQVERHLVACAACRQQLEVVRENASVARSALGSLAPMALEVPQPSWSRIRDRAESGLGGPVTLGWRVSQMFRNLLSLAAGSRVRLAASAMAALVMVSLLFSLSPVQTAASSFLSIFRVKKFVAVTVDPSSLPNLASPAELGGFTIKGDSKRRTATMDEAEQAVGFRVMTPTAFPSWIEGNPRVMVADSSTVTFTPDLQKVQAYLSSIGASDVRLPDSLDGAPISVQMPPSVALLYLERGGADRSADGTPMPLAGQRHLYLGAATSPTMNVPDGIDVEQLRSEFLKIPGLPADLVNQLKAIDDWRNTVVVPVVKGTSREVTVQGERGLLITESGGNGTTLLWLNGGVIYTLSGTVSDAEILAAADSMR